MHHRMKVNMAVALLQDTTIQSGKFLGILERRRRAWGGVCFVGVRDAEAASHYEAAPAYGSSLKSFSQTERHDKN
jgi:hypothetical protein